MATFRTREISYSAETTFADDADSPASATFSKRIPVIDARVTLEQDRQPDNSLQVRQNETRPGYLLTRGGTIELDFYWSGHNAAATGALTETWQQELLAAALGGGNVASVGGTCTGSGTTATLPFSSATLVRGGAIRLGSKNDGRGDGQFYVIGATTTSPASLLTDLPVAGDNADVVHAAQVAYPAETGHETIRILAGWTETGAQYVAFGCQAESVTFNLPIGDLPTVTIRYRVAYWARAAQSVPVVATLEECYAAPIAGGSIFFQTVGTTTRATIEPVEMSLSLEMGLSEKPSVAGQTYQRIGGWQRTMARPTFAFKAVWSSTYETLHDSDGADTTHKHILVTLSTQAKRAVGFYLPRAYISGQRPTFSDFNDQLYQDVTFTGREGTDTTNELTRSAVRFFSA